MNTSNSTTKNFFFAYNTFFDQDAFLKNWFKEHNFTKEDEVIYLKSTALNKSKILELQNHFQKKQTLKQALVMFETETLNKEVINAFLLFLEENKRIYFLFFSQQEHLVLPTLISRCVKFNLEGKKSKLVEFLKKNQREEKYFFDFCFHTFASLDQIQNYLTHFFDKHQRLLQILLKQQVDFFFELQTWIKTCSFDEIKVFFSLILYDLIKKDDNFNRLKKMFFLNNNLNVNMNRLLLVTNLLLIFRD